MEDDKCKMSFRELVLGLRAQMTVMWLKKFELLYDNLGKLIFVPVSIDDVLKKSDDTLQKIINRVNEHSHNFNDLKDWGSGHAGKIAKRSSDDKGIVWVKSENAQNVEFSGIQGEVSENPKLQDVLDTKVEAENKLEAISGVIRQDEKDSGWYKIVNDRHASSGIQDISVNTEGKLLINHTPDAIKVGDLEASSDESFLPFNIRFGASVGEKQSTIRAFMPVNININTSTIGIDVSPYASDNTTVSQAEDGIITVLHKTADSRLCPHIEYSNTSDNSAGLTWNVGNFTDTMFELVPYGTMAIHLFWDTDHFSITSSNLVENPTVAVDDDGKITCSFATPIGPSKSYDIFTSKFRYKTENYTTQVYYTSNTTYSFYIIKPDGSRLAKADFTSDTKFYLTCLEKVRVKDTFGYLKVSRDMEIDFNKLYGTSANIWVRGAMVK